jgi:hypothetical protein
LAEWSEQIGHGMPNPTSFSIPLTQLILPSFGNHTATVVCQKWNHSTTHNVPLHPPARYPPTPMGRNSHNFYLNQIPHKVKAQLLAFIYERMSSPRNSSGQHSLDRAQAICQNQAFFWGLYNLSDVSQSHKQST